MFDDFFKQATGCRPYPYQCAFAQDGELPELLNVPTGVGKTATAILGWLYRRRHADQAIREMTPRRLVYCLPMRTLVEQTRDCAIRWLDRLGEFAGTVAYETTGSGLIESYSLDVTRADAVAVHVLMGGAKSDNWAEHPERDAILIGTQDMLLSRALNRGYAARRGRWPTEFGLLLNDSLWVFDEVQLMGSALATSVQLDAFAKKLWPPLKPTQFVWMSATLGSDMLQTRDRNDWGLTEASTQSLTEHDFDEPEIDRRLNAPKRIQVAAKKPKPADILAQHMAGRVSLVVLNTVLGAKETYRELSEELVPRPVKGEKKGSASATKTPKPELLLLHGRFRPMDRAVRMKQLNQFLARMDRETGAVANHPGLIVVSTQVIEAGFDVSAARLWSEIAPWSSTIQRLGRLNREGAQPDATAVFWMPKTDDQNKGDNVPNAKRIGPYDKPALDVARKLIEAVVARQTNGERYREALDVVLATPESASALKIESDVVIRPPDFFGLFSTEPDLAGGFTNVAPFVRSQDRDVDVHVFWRDFDPVKSRDWTQSEPDRDELCPVPFFEFRTFLGKTTVAWEWNFETTRWESRRAGDIQPGMTLLLPKSAGGYRSDSGWSGTTNDHDFSVMPDRGEQGDGFDADRWSGFQSWLELDQHLLDVEAEVTELSDSVGLKGSTHADALRIAGRWHDWGKGVASWQTAVARYVERTRENLKQVISDSDFAEFHEVAEHWLGIIDSRIGQKILWAKFPDPRAASIDKRVVHLPLARLAEFRKRLTSAFRPGLRHEAASALAAWQAWRDGDSELSALAVYLIASHHGKVRTALSSRTDRDEVFGLNAGDKLPKVDGIFPNGVELQTDCRRVGASGEWDEAGGTFSLNCPSWLQMVAELLGPTPGGAAVAREVIPENEPQALGPLALAYLEALLVAADIRASRTPGKGARS